MENDRYIYVLYKQPNKKPKRIQIENKLEDMQKLVDGYIEIVRYKDVFLVCNEEAKLRGLEPNVTFGSEVICGSFFLIGDDKVNADFISLTEKQIKKYKKEIAYNIHIDYELEDEME